MLILFCHISLKGAHSSEVTTPEATSQSSYLYKVLSYGYYDVWGRMKTSSQFHKFEDWVGWQILRAFLKKEWKGIEEPKLIAGVIAIIIIGYYVKKRMTFSEQPQRMVYPVIIRQKRSLY
jgi:hypothetical protein